MLYVIDGTGPLANDTYSKAMENGFCRSAARSFGGSYYRGPSLLGFETGKIAYKVWQDILKDRRLGREPLFLAGHSRGGAAAIRVAQLLGTSGQGQTVRALFLFDAVDRTDDVSIQVQKIPANVEKTYHAIREQSLSDYFLQGLESAYDAYQKALQRQRAFETFGRPPSASVAEAERRYRAMQALDFAMGLRMRARFMVRGGVSIPFGNCGTGLVNPAVQFPGDRQSKQRLVTAKFLGSHGALGGAPIGAELSEDDRKALPAEDRRALEFCLMHDRAAMAGVYSWMSDAFRFEGIKPVPDAIGPLLRSTARSC